ncbi:hypothetical protein IJ380_02210 [Candidatus Saccharibacteria bacterium]|nr:hypothetical protein [Candidatus Saccharibacteria bacterium]
MFYEYIENLKARLYFLKHKDDAFVPAGTDPVASPEPEPRFSFDLKSFNPKEMSFETKRLIVLAAVFIVSLISVGMLSSNLNAFRAERDAYRATHQTSNKENAWDTYKEEKAKQIAPKEDSKENTERISEKDLNITLKD